MARCPAPRCRPWPRAHGGRSRWTSRSRSRASRARSTHRGQGRPGGLYFFAIAAEEFARVERYEFVGNRSATKKQAAEAALRLVLDYLDGLEGLEAGAG